MHDLKMIAEDLATILSDDHDIDVDTNDILPHLAGFLEKIAPGIISDREGSMRRPFKELRNRIQRLEDGNRVALVRTDPELLRGLAVLRGLGAGFITVPLTPEEEHVLDCDETPDCDTQLHVARCPKAGPQ